MVVLDVPDGTPTAGSTGQPLMFGLPGGGSGVVCTVRTLAPDGSEFDGIGIQPDITVLQTAADVRSASDSALRAAINAILHNGN